jgi:hypothetical protein
MRAQWAERHRRLAWLIGTCVLLGLGIGVGAMIARATRGVSVTALTKAPANAVVEPLAARQPVVAPRAAAPAERGASVRGIVRLPGGDPAAGATVTLYRAATEWPEWQREPIDQAVFTGRDGLFQFGVDDPLGLLIGFEHASFAGGLVEVPTNGMPLELRLEPGFPLGGVVTNDAGAPVIGARVALEPLTGDARRVQVAVTGRNGRYAFANVRGGSVRLVARHANWQPASVPSLVIGEVRSFDVRFERPSMTPLRGRVTALATQAPVEGALVQLLPLNQKPGQVDPIEVRTGADGGFLLAGVPRGSMRFLVRHPDHGSVVRTESVGALAADLQIEMPSRSEVSGSLDTHRPPALHRGGERIQLRDKAGQLAWAVIAADGTFRFEQPLSPGLATLRLIDGEFAFQRSMTTEVSVFIDESRRTELDIGVVSPSRVRGRFVDTAGRPVAGVVVMPTKVLLENVRSIGDAALDLDLGSLTSQLAQLAGADRDEPLVTSAADGTFELRGLPPGAPIVRPVSRGYGSRWLRVAVPPPGGRVDLGDIQLARGLRLGGRVVRGDGAQSRPVAGAVVSVDGRQAKAVALTDPNGQWVVDDLVAGEYRVRARLGAQSGSVELAQPVLLRGDAPPPPPAVLRLELGRSVRGVVTGSAGQPLVGAVVSVRGSGTQSIATDGAGEFQLELPERAIDLVVSHGDRSRSRVLQVQPSQRQVAVQLDTPPTCTVIARIAGLPGQKRIAAGVLRWSRIDGADGAVEGDASSRWIEFVDGELRWSSAPIGRVRLEIWCDGYAPFVSEQVLAANQEHVLKDVLLEPGGRLHGVVRDAAGLPVVDAMLLLGEETDLELFEGRTRSAADGSFRITGITGRSSRLVVRAPGFAPAVVDLQLPADLLASEPYVVALERGALIEVSVGSTLAREGGFVQLRRGSRVLATAEIDDIGRASFANRGAGVYTVMLLDRAGPPKSVRVEPGDSLRRVQLP